MRCLALMTLSFALFSVAACQSPALTRPCDVLVPINPAAATNSYLVRHDRPVAVAIAQHRGRYQKYECGSENDR